MVAALKNQRQQCHVAAACNNMAESSDESKYGASSSNIASVLEKKHQIYAWYLF